MRDRAWLFRFLRPRYEAWAYVTCGDERSEGRRLRAPLSLNGRFWTRKGAETWAQQITGSPLILAASIDARLRTGRAPMAEYEVRRV